MTFAATIFAVTRTGDIIREPSVQGARSATSLHALAFSSKGHLLLNESQGKFDFDTWEKVYERAESVCLDSTGSGDSDDYIPMVVDDADGQPVEALIREIVKDQVYKDYAWKIGD